MNRTTTHPPTNTLTVPSADILASRAAELLDRLACGQWAPARKLREALRCYSEIRLGVAMSEQATIMLEHCQEKTPDTLRTGEVGQ